MKTKKIIIKKCKDKLKNVNMNDEYKGSIERFDIILNALNEIDRLENPILSTNKQNPFKWFSQQIFI